MGGNIAWEDIKQDLLGEFQESSQEQFVNALFVVAECQVEENKQLPNREEVNHAIAQIVWFVRHSESENEAVSNMFGFAKVKVQVNAGEETVEGWSSTFEQMSNDSLKEYLYFVADMKIKATVYLLRIHNFLKNGGLENVYETEESVYKQIEELTTKDVEIFFEVRISGSEQRLKDFVLDSLAEGEKEPDYRKYIASYKLYMEKKEETQLAKLIKIEQARCDELEKKEFPGMLPIFARYKEIKNRNNEYCLNDAKYYLFDNSMKELAFTGIGWNWKWKYEMGEADLFRCSNGKDEYIYKWPMYGSGRDYYKHMIQSIVEHMKKGRDKCTLASYSKDPYLDIYKYMSLEKERGSYYFKAFKSEDDTIQVELKYLEQGEEKALPYRNGEVTFAMVKRAKTNVIKPLRACTMEECDYTIGVKGSKVFGKAATSEAVYNFSEFVMSAGNGDCIFCVDILNNMARQQAGDVRKVLKAYMVQFMEGPGLQLQVVATRDKEVVMLGNTCDKIVRLNSKEDVPSYDYEALEDNTEYRVTLSGQEIIGLFQLVRGKMSGFDIEKDKVKKNSFEIDIKGMKELLEEQIDEVEGVDEKAERENRNKAKNALEKRVKEAIQGYLENIRKENEGNWKLRVIEGFLEKHTDKANYLGATVYKKDERDTFINFCREVYLK